MGKIRSKEIREYWENNPFFVEECPYKIGTRKFYDYLDYLRDKDVERFSKHLWRFSEFRRKRVLDVGSGTVGWLVRNYAKNGAEVYSIDITQTAVNSIKAALKLYDLKAKVIRADAENMPFKDNYFDFVSAMGSIEHAANTEKCVNEIYRVLKPGGEATVSLYYKSVLFKKWFFPFTLLFLNLFLRAPHREGMKKAKNPEELMRRVDGDMNPKGSMYSREEVKQLFSKFEIKNIECHMFLMHFVSKIVPRFLHPFLDKFFPLKIYIQVRKPIK